MKIVLITTTDIQKGNKEEYINFEAYKYGISSLRQPVIKQLSITYNNDKITATISSRSPLYTNGLRPVEFRSL